MKRELCNICGVSGYESEVAKRIYEILKDTKYDDLKIDAVGNVILLKKGKIGQKKVMISAHMDEVGFQVVNKISDYMYKIKPLGNIKTWNAFQQRVESNNSFGVIRAFDEANLRANNYENIYLEILNGNGVETGDIFSFEKNFKETDTDYFGKALDNRLACSSLIETIKENISTSADIYYVFTTQEEIGMRGIRVAKSTIEPDYFINIDVSAVGNMNSIQMSKGVGIKISDSMCVSSIALVKLLKEIAIDSDIIFQMEVSDCGTSELIITNELDYGVEEVGISIPCKYLHSANSVVKKNDLMECEKLIHKMVKKF